MTWWFLCALKCFIFWIGFSIASSKIDWWLSKSFFFYFLLCYFNSSNYLLTFMSNSLLWTIYDWFFNLLAMRSYFFADDFKNNSLGAILFCEFQDLLETAAPFGSSAPAKLGFFFFFFFLAFPSISSVLVHFAIGGSCRRCIRAGNRWNFGFFQFKMNLLQIDLRTGWTRIRGLPIRFLRSNCNFSLVPSNMIETLLWSNIGWSRVTEFWLLYF